MTGDYLPLFKHMSDNHNLTLMDGELEEIIDVVKSIEKGKLDFDPSKPFEVSDDGTFTDVKTKYDKYLGCDERFDYPYFVSRNGGCSSFKHIRNTIVKEVKIDEIEAIKVNGELIENFKIVE